MPDWREVCDECSTTLFNHHYMCKQCGYMTCIECWHRIVKMSKERRRSNSFLTDERRSDSAFLALELKRACSHYGSYSLSELIPWRRECTGRSFVASIDDCLPELELVYAQTDAMAHLSQLKLQYPIQLDNSSRCVNLSSFIKSLQMKRSCDAPEVRTRWSSAHCNYDTSIEFYCRGRLPVFTEWESPNAERVC